MPAASAQSKSDGAVIKLHQRLTQSQQTSEEVINIWEFVVNGFWQRYLPAYLGMTNTTGSNKKIQQKSNTSGLGSCNKFIIDFNLTPLFCWCIGDYKHKTYIIRQTSIKFCQTKESFNSLILNNFQIYLLYSTYLIHIWKIYDTVPKNWPQKEKFKEKAKKRSWRT